MTGYNPTEVTSFWDCDGRPECTFGLRLDTGILVNYDGYGTLRPPGRLAITAKCDSIRILQRHGLIRL